VSVVIIPLCTSVLLATPTRSTKRAQHSTAQHSTAQHSTAQHMHQAGSATNQAATASFGIRSVTSVLQAVFCKEALLWSAGHQELVRPWPQSD